MPIDLIKSDLQKFTKARKISIFSTLKYYIIYREFRIVYLYRKRHQHKLNKNKIRYTFFTTLNQLTNSTVYINEDAEIGEGFQIIHAFGIAIGKIRAGKNFRVHHNVTLGANDKITEKGEAYPMIGDNVTIAPSATIIGPVSIGSEVMIGANSVVLKNIPGGTVVAGVPAKIIGKYEKERFTDKKAILYQG